MIKKVVVEVGKRDVECLELSLFAFKSKKGIFTLSGSNTNGTDEWRQLGTCNFYTWDREDIHQWFVSGKISVVERAKTIDWYMCIENKK